MNLDFEQAYSKFQSQEQEVPQFPRSYALTTLNQVGILSKLPDDIELYQTSIHLNVPGIYSQYYNLFTTLQIKYSDTWKILVCSSLHPRPNLIYP